MGVRHSHLLDHHDLLAVVQREVVGGVSLFLDSPCMLYLLLHASLLRFCLQLFARQQGITTREDDRFVEMARIVALRYGGESASDRAAFVTVQPPLRLFSMAWP